MIGRCHDRRTAEAVRLVMGWMPGPLVPLVACEWVLGVDPVFAGIHRYTASTSGYSYGSTAHTVLPYHQGHRPASHRGPKVVLPTRRGYEHGRFTLPFTVAHELGHVLDWRLGHTHTAETVSEYARTDRGEAFAEAFGWWLIGQPVDVATQALLDGLAGTLPGTGQRSR